MTAEPRRLPRAERERQTLDVAQALFARRGFAAVTMDEVAAGVGVTKPLLYNYFGNKERLYLACVGRTADSLLERIGAAVAGAADPGEGLREAVRAFFAFVEADRAAWSVLYDETLPTVGEVAAHVAAYRAQAAALVAAALSQLDPAPEPALTPGLAEALLGAVEAFARWWLRDGIELVSAADAADAFIAFVRPGLARPTRLRPSQTGTP